MTIRSDGHGLRDDPLYISHMALWISTHNVAFTSYFEWDAPDGEHALTDGHFHRSLAAFRRSFAAAKAVAIPDTGRVAVHAAEASTVAAASGHARAPTRSALPDPNVPWGAQRSASWPGTSGAGREVSPINHRSTLDAHDRPSAMAHTMRL